jgi:hypothetical protein
MIETQRKFLSEAWNIIFGHPIKEVQKYFLSDYIDSTACDMMPSATTVEKAIQICVEMNAIPASFEKTIDILNHNWEKLTPLAKKDLIASITSNGIANCFSADKLRLNPDEESALNIRWDIANALYVTRKKEAMERVKDIGLDFKGRTLDCGRNTLPYMLETVFKEFFGLLQYRLETSLAVILIAEIQREKQIKEVIAHANEEYLCMLEDLRSFLNEMLLPLSTASESLRPKITEIAERVMQTEGIINERLKSEYTEQIMQSMKKDRVREYTETLLKPFSDGYDRMITGIADEQPSPELLRKVNKLIGGIRMTQNTNITITGDGNVIGNNNKILTNINKKVQSRSQDLAEAFGFLKGDILQLQGVEDKLKQQAIRAVEDAESEAGDMAADTQTIESSLQRAKNILEKAGETFDEAEGWGARLAKVATVAVNFIPGEWGWLAQLANSFLGNPPK